MNFLLLITTLLAPEGRRGFEWLEEITKEDIKYEKYNIKPDQIDHDENRNITAISYYQGQISYQYEYDSKNRLIRAKYHGPDSSKISYGQLLPPVRDGRLPNAHLMKRKEFIELDMFISYDDFWNRPEYFEVSGLISYTESQNYGNKVTHKELLDLPHYKFTFDYGFFGGVNINVVEGNTINVNYPYYEILGKGETNTLVLEDDLVQAPSIFEDAAERIKDKIFPPDIVAETKEYLYTQRQRQIIEVFLEGSLFRKASHIPFKTRFLF